MKSFKIYFLYILCLIIGATATLKINGQSVRSPSPYEILIDSAENLTRASSWNQAADLYRQALRINPGSPLNSKLFANLGLCLAQAGKYPDALEAYEIALVKEPNSAAILSGKGAALVAKGDVAEAIRCLDKALQNDSLHPASLRLHGQLMLHENQLPSATCDFSRLMKADPTDPWGPAGLAEVKLDSRLPSEAIPLFIKALQLQESPDFRISLIIAMLRANQLADAEETIHQSLILYPQQGEFYLLRGILHKTLHQNRDAELDKKYAVQYGVDPQIIERYFQFSSE